MNHWSSACAPPLFGDESTLRECLRDSACWSWYVFVHTQKREREEKNERDHLIIFPRVHGQNALGGAENFPLRTFYKDSRFSLHGGGGVASIACAAQRPRIASPGQKTHMSSNGKLALSIDPEDSRDFARSWRTGARARLAGPFLFTLFFTGGRWVC